MESHHYLVFHFAKSFDVSYAFGGMANVRYVEGSLLKVLEETNGKR